MPRYADDWAYSFIFRTNNRIDSIGDIFYSQYRHYYLWGGRFVAHFIAQFLLFTNKYVAAILNTSIYVLLIYIISIISTKTFKANFLVLIISSLFILFVPNPLETIIWITGSANYLWTTFIVLLFLMPFVFNIYKSGYQKGNPFFIFICGVIAGWTNENTGFALIIAILIFSYLFKKKYNKIPIWAILGLVGAVIGFCLMILAPGNNARVDAEYIDNFNIPYLHLIVMRIKSILYKYMLHVLPFTIFYLLIFIIYKLSSCSKDKDKVCISIIFLLMAHLSIFIMIVSPTFPERASFSSVVFSIVSISVLLSNIEFREKILNKAFFAIIILLLTESCSNFFILYKDVNQIKVAMNERDIIIENSIQKGIKNINIIGDSMVFKTGSLSDLSKDSTFWFNKAYAKYRNIHTVSLRKMKE